ncbi:MAG: TIGR01777 family oxidoreductase [Fimbriimonadales bacterium]
MKIVIAGGSGFIGRAMVSAWAPRSELVVLTRNPERTQPKLPSGARAVGWDGQASGEWVQELANADALVNLSGETIAQRWTPAVKERLRTSRVVPTQCLVQAVESLDRRPSVWLQASAIGVYDQSPETTATEASPPGSGFLAELGQAWERAAEPVASLGIRLCYLRIGVVLGEGGGALERMLTPFKLGVGGPIGSGDQWLSWIHLDDVVGAAEFLIQRADLSGAFNFTAPNPVTMNEFARTLARVLVRPAPFRVPGFALKLMMGEMAEIVLEGSKVLPQRLLEAGYPFRYPELEPALRTLLGK